MILPARRKYESRYRICSCATRAVKQHYSFTIRRYLIRSRIVTVEYSRLIIRTFLSRISALVPHGGGRRKGGGRGFIASTPTENHDRDSRLRRFTAYNMITIIVNRRITLRGFSARLCRSPLFN